jgi:hypothetical protein
MPIPDPPDSSFVPEDRSAPEETGAPGQPSTGGELDGPGESSVAVLLDQVPEFSPAYLSLVQVFDEHPGEPIVFTELADFVAERLAALETERPVLERALAAVETVAATSEDATELVGYAFLDSLSPEDRRRIVPWLGPHARSLLDELDASGW